MRTRLVAVVALAAVAACGGNDKEQPPPPIIFASCNLDAPTTGSLCIEFAGPLSASEKTDLEALCTGLLQATWSAGLCPVVNRSGTCTFVGTYGFVVIPEMTVYERHYDAASASTDAQACAAQGGSWIPN